MLRKITNLVLLGAFLASCSAPITGPVSDADRTRTFTANYTPSFRAVVKYLTDQGYTVARSDEDQGLIVTETKQEEPEGDAAVTMKITVMMRELDSGGVIGGGARLTQVTLSITKTVGGMEVEPGLAAYRRIMDALARELS